MWRPGKEISHLTGLFGSLNLISDNLSRVSFDRNKRGPNQRESCKRPSKTSHEVSPVVQPVVTIFGLAIARDSDDQVCSLSHRQEEGEQDEPELSDWAGLHDREHLLCVASHKSQGEISHF